MVNNIMVEKSLFRNITVIIMALMLGLSALLSVVAYASTPEELYSSAVKTTEALKKSPERQKYRHNWFKCIQKFEAVYKNSPNHSLAPSGMYHAAELYLKLYQISAAGRDKEEAVDLLNRIIKRYPSSTDRDLAEKLLSSIKNPSDAASAKNSPEEPIEKKANGKKANGKKSELTESADPTYPAAESASDSTGKRESADSAADNNGDAYVTDLRYWTTPDYTRIVLNVSEERRYVYQFLDENISLKKPQRLYLDIKKSLLAKNLPTHTRINDDLLIQARAGQHNGDTVRVVIDIKAFESYKVFSLKDPFRVIVDVWGAKEDQSKGTPEKENLAESEDSGTSEIKNGSAEAEQPDKAIDEEPRSAVSAEVGIKKSRKRSTKSSDEVSASKESATEEKTAPANPEKENMEESHELSSKVSTKSATKSASAEVDEDNSFETNSKEAASLPVKRSRKKATMILSESTRALLRESAKQDKEAPQQIANNSSKSSSSKKSGSRQDTSKSLSASDEPISPRTKGKATKGTTRVVQEQIAPGSNVYKIKASSIAKQLALGVRTIVIDPGHGGKDPGASGPSGVYEKDVVLSIAKKLASRIRSRLNCNVIMTRSSDTYLTLEERTAIANTRNADLFISIHCNASTDRKLVGIETYYLNLATDDRAINVAARENATSRKNISDLESILNDLMKNAKINESSRLASVVQDRLYRGMVKRYPESKNLGVKQAPFYVLLGASMPSVLIETSFISNPQECRRLIDSTYQSSLCDAIVDGVAKYIKETNPQF